MNYSSLLHASAHGARLSLSAHPDRRCHVSAKLAVPTLAYLSGGSQPLFASVVAASLKMHGSNDVYL